MTLNVVPNISKIIFRSNDIRGKVQDQLTPDAAYSIGLAFGSESLLSEQQKIIVARDGRLSSPSLSQAVTQGLIDSGVDVINIGAVPTPLLYFATHTLDTSSGIMVTGSHNPVDYNGLKIVLKHQILSEKQIQSLYNRIQQNDFLSGNGKVTTTNIVPSYYSTILKDIKIKRKFRIVIDSGNGIPGKVFPELARKLGCEVIELYCDVDGTFPNHFPDPSVPKNLEALIESVKKNKADLGIAFDGDGDRLGIVTNKGNIIWPDRQLMLFSKQVLNQNPNSTIIYDVKCTRQLEPWIKKHHGTPLMWKTGHSLIKEKIKEVDAKLAGEMSGHFYFNDRWFGFDDALYSAARFLEILSEENDTVENVFSHLPNSISTPELRAPFPDDTKFKFIENFKNKSTFKEGKINTVDGVRVDFDYGFGLVRASNTTPCLILRFEADTPQNLKNIQEIFKQKLLSLEPNLQLPF